MTLDGNHIGYIRAIIGSYPQFSSDRLHQTDLQLWQACKCALVSDKFSRGLTLNFVNLGQTLCTAISRSEQRVVAKLAEPSVCSFFPRIIPDAFSSEIRRSDSWRILEDETRYAYYPLRFASIYWYAVWQAAAASKKEAATFFQLDQNVIDNIANASLIDLQEFLHVNASMHYFDLTSSIKDCLEILKIANAFSSDTNRRFSLSIAKIKKSNHCSNYFRSSLTR